MGRRPRRSDQPHEAGASGVLRRRNQNKHQLLSRDSRGFELQARALRHWISRSVVCEPGRRAAHSRDASRFGGARRRPSIFEPIRSSRIERNTLESVENGGPARRIETAMKYTAVVAGKSIEIEFEKKNGTIEARIGNRHYTLESSNVEPGVYWFNLNNRSIEVRV